METIVQTVQAEFKFNPYPYQHFPFTVYQNGVKRIILVWPRRAGKDLTAVNFTLVRALERVGTYFYFLPTHRQAKRIIWDGMDDEGNKFLSYIPPELIADKNESELQITLVNDSIIQLIGADTIDTSAVGTNCIGAVFSEYSIQKQAGWDYVRPILRKNGGWALFIYTPRGHNHGYELYDLNKTNPEWGVNKLVAADIVDQHGVRLITDQMIEAERLSGMADEKIEQEFNTSFSGIQQGSFFADQCIEAETSQRYGMYPYDVDFRVHTVSDLGVGLNFATWCFQIVRGKCHWIDYFVLDKGGIPEFVQELRNRKYVYGDHFAPHDVKTTDVSTGQTRIQAAARLGVHFRRIPRLPVADRIEAGRRIFPVSCFHKQGVTNKVSVKSGWGALLNYRRLYDEDKKEYSNDEVHDWASHGGSAFTYGALAIRRLMNANLGGGQAEVAFDEHEDAPATDAEVDFDEFSD